MGKNIRSILRRECGDKVLYVLPYGCGVDCRDKFIDDVLKIPMKLIKVNRNVELLSGENVYLIRIATDSLKETKAAFKRLFDYVECFKKEKLIEDLIENLKLIDEDFYIFITSDIVYECCSVKLKVRLVIEAITSENFTTDDGPGEVIRNISNDTDFIMIIKPVNTGKHKGIITEVSTTKEGPHYGNVDMAKILGMLSTTMPEIFEKTTIPFREGDVEKVRNIINEFLHKFSTDENVKAYVEKIAGYTPDEFEKLLGLLMSLEESK